MPSSRDWVLLANYADKTLMRNSLAMQLGTAMGMAWTPRSAFVEGVAQRQIRRRLPAHGKHQDRQGPREHRRTGRR
jgi:hypothetical protein